MASISQQPSNVRLPDHPQQSGWIEAVDPRVRILTAVALSLVMAMAQTVTTLACALLAGVVAACFTGLHPLVIFRRLLPVNGFIAILFLLLPLSTGSEELFRLGPLCYTREGFHMALAIGLKANAMVLWIVVLLSTLDMVTMGHALSHLGVPDKLSHLLLFSVRYLNLLHSEYVRLRTAMKIRGFRPRVNRHTYRSLGFLVAMLLVRSLDRSDRVLAAMKCRGFRGQFYLLDHFAYSRRDIWFSAGAIFLMALLTWMEFS
jgi:cobalt/nickel transport system permease protein